MSDEDAAAFLKVAEQFQLGDLETEQPHPKTSRLAGWSREDLPHAIEVLREIDLEALETLRTRLASVEPLSVALGETLQRGRSVFLCGCGATGRLSLFCRTENLIPHIHADQVIGFMVGGDAALIRSIERFEDRLGFGERQLCELGFQEGDLLVASTEAGETPFVIGATETVACRSSNRPFFLYGNPDEQLRAKVERSRRVLEDSRIRKVNLSTGPMALSGSTRMQASTVLMAAIGLALRGTSGQGCFEEEADRSLKALIAWWESVSLASLIPFIEEEAAIYQRGEYVLYEPGLFGITVLTDTTERSPTFVLVPFENESRPEDLPSLCHLRIPGTRDAAEAWRVLLHREPRALE